MPIKITPSPGWKEKLKKGIAQAIKERSKDRVTQRNIAGAANAYKDKDRLTSRDLRFAKRLVSKQPKDRATQRDIAGGPEESLGKRIGKALGTKKYSKGMTDRTFTDPKTALIAHSLKTKDRITRRDVNAAKMLEKKAPAGAYSALIKQRKNEKKRLYPSRENLYPVNSRGGRRRSTTFRSLSDEKAREMGFSKRVKEDLKNKRDEEKLEMPRWNSRKRTFSHGGEARVRGMGAAIKGGKFEGVF